MNKPQKKTPKKPHLPKAKRKTLPVTVSSYFKKGKRVLGYKRRKAGDASRDGK